MTIVIEPWTSRRTLAPPRPRRGSRASTHRREASQARRPDSTSAHADLPEAGPRTWRKIKWAVLVVTLGVYYLLPWMRWDRGPSAPQPGGAGRFRQASVYFFFIELWPQEVYFITGLLVLAALGAVPGHRRCSGGCGAATPARRRSGPTSTSSSSGCSRATATPACGWTRRPGPSTRSGARAASTRSGWLIAVATGGAWVFYFHDAPTLAARARSRRGADGRVYVCRSASSPSPPTRSPAACASRSAPTCARGRASRAR